MALFPKTPTDRTADRRAAQEHVFLREVDDALREDDTFALLRRYGMRVGAVIVVVLLGLAGWMAWTGHVNALAGQKGEAMTIALDQVDSNRFDPARKSLDQIAGGSGPGYANSARLVAAGVALDQKKPADAAKIYASVAADAHAPQAYRDLATVRSVAAQFDTLPPQQVIERLKPLAVSGNAWFGSAGEMTAAAQMKLGQTAAAGATLAAMAKDSTVPESLRRRSRQLAIQLGVDPGDDPAAAAKPMAAGLAQDAAE